METFDTLRGFGRTYVRIGAGSTWFEERLPEVLSSFSTKQPQVRIDASFIPRFEIIEALLLGHIDIGLAQFGFETLPSDDIEYEELLSDRLVVIGRKGHPLSGKLASAKAFSKLLGNTPSASSQNAFVVYVSALELMIPIFISNVILYQASWILCEILIL